MPKTFQSSELLSSIVFSLCLKMGKFSSAHLRAVDKDLRTSAF